MTVQHKLVWKDLTDLGLFYKETYCLFVLLLRMGPSVFLYACFENLDLIPSGNSPSTRVLLLQVNCIQFIDSLYY